MLEQLNQYWGVGVAIGGVIGGILWSKRKAQNDSGREDGNPKSSGTLCKYGESNRERIADTQAEQRVIKAEIAEIQRQLDEVFSRLRSLEATANQILGHLKEKL